MNDRRGYVVHGQALRHRLLADALISISLAQSLAIHQDRLGFLYPLDAGELALQFAHALLGFPPLQPQAARDRQIRKQSEWPDRPLDDSDRTRLKHQLQRRWVLDRKSVV